MKFIYLFAKCSPRYLDAEFHGAPKTLPWSPPRVFAERIYLAPLEMAIQMGINGYGGDVAGSFRLVRNVDCRLATPSIGEDENVPLPKPRNVQ